MWLAIYQVQRKLNIFMIEKTVEKIALELPLVQLVLLFFCFPQVVWSFLFKLQQHCLLVVALLTASLIMGSINIECNNGANFVRDWVFQELPCLTIQEQVSWSLLYHLTWDWSPFTAAQLTLTQSDQFFLLAWPQSSYSRVSDIRIL